MTKKLFLRLSLITTSALSLQSCATEDFTLQEDSPSELLSAAKTSSKSLWEEDEKYIAKVKGVYTKNADENYIRETYGTISWDYAMTMDQFDESYLIVPVLKNNKVVNTLEVFREKSRVYFQFSGEDKEAVDFFQTLIFNRDNIKAEPSPVYKDASAKTGTIRVSVCKKYTFIVYPVEGAGGDQSPIESTKTICKFVDMALPASECLGMEDPITGECMGGGTGTGEGGYDYPDPPEEDDDSCKKVQDKLADPRIKNQFNALNTQENFDNDHEVGFIETTSKINNANVKTFTPASGPPCKDYVKLPPLATGMTGFGHTHNDVDCRGKRNILVPSVDDIDVFLSIMAKQAGDFYGDFSKGYYFTVTSGGSYMFQYTGSIAPQNLSFNYDALYDEYKDVFNNLRNRYPDMPQSKVEEAFMKFLEEEVNIDGLELYEVTADSTKKIEYNSGLKIIDKIPCP